MLRRPAGLLASAVLGLCLLFILSGCTETLEPPDPATSGSVVGALGGEDLDAYARAIEPREFRFPEDHGAHPEYRTEWWYVTGNLDDPQGRRFGFQITFFRFALSPEAPESASRWATNQGWMAHLGLTDVAGDRHLALERFSRGAAGLAGAELDPFRVWLDDWELAAVDGNDFPWRFTTGEHVAPGEPAMALEFRPLKPIVLHGEQGLSQKSPEPGNASYYYSLTRLETQGWIRIDGQTHTVSGLSWLDREWHTNVLGEGQVGWDWFSLQLHDGQDLMVAQLRREDGSIDPMNQGLWVHVDGRTERLGRDDFELQVLDTWTSPSGSRYPVRWLLRLPERGRSLELRAVRPDQEMDLSVRYWEGALDVLEDGRPSGRGFAELTGY